LESSIVYQAEVLDEGLKRKYALKNGGKCCAKLFKSEYHFIRDPSFWPTVADASLFFFESRAEIDSWSEEELLTNFRQEVSVMWSLAFHKNIIKLIGYVKKLHTFSFPSSHLIVLIVSVKSPFVLSQNCTPTA
jgi:hypothetical protein